MANVTTATGQDRWFNVINTTIVTIFFVLVLAPLLYVLAASFSDALAVIQGRVWFWPVDFNIEGYRAVFRHPRIMSGFANSFFYVIVGTVINVTLTVLAAYPLSRKDFVDRNLFMTLFVFTIMFNGGLIPTYLLVKSLGMLDTRAALLFPLAIGAWNVIITRTYFQHTIPNELLEAAQMDGCKDFRFLWSVVLPLSGPIIAVITLFYAVQHWNQFFQALLYLKDEAKYPLQLILREILVENQVSSQMTDMDIDSLLLRQQLRELLKYSLIIVASAPMLILYPFIQKYFVKGIMIGSLKG
ncbi:MAG TPA: carbohydrate ABC transporter permease [Spirochaetia bacterium]|nr:carbohydrate ABC transporter permease [Spirochaetia bacterium]